MQLTNQEICEAFSKGNFEITYNYLAEDIEWNIIGDKILKSKNSVIDFCNKTAQYFSEVTTIFSITNLITEGNCVVINGTAQFVNKQDKTTHVSSCDVYRFKVDKLQDITSYCIITSNK